MNRRPPIAVAALILVIIPRTAPTSTLSPI